MKINKLMLMLFKIINFLEELIEVKS